MAIVDDILLGGKPILDRIGGGLPDAQPSA
jgi:hypothetical protein